MKRLIAIVCLPLSCLSGCSFDGSKILPKPPGLKIKTPSGFNIRADSDLTGKVIYKDGAGKELEVEILSSASAVVKEQVALAQQMRDLMEQHNVYVQHTMQSLSQLTLGLAQAIVPVIVRPPVPPPEPPPPILVP